jgi:hypothetical protein
VKWKWLHIEANSAQVKIWEEVARTYEAAHPGVKITAVLRRRRVEPRGKDEAGKQRQHAMFHEGQKGKPLSLDARELRRMRSPPLRCRRPRRSARRRRARPAPSCSPARVCPFRHSYDHIILII